MDHARATVGLVGELALSAVDEDGELDKQAIIRTVNITIFMRTYLILDGEGKCGALVVGSTGRNGHAKRLVRQMP